MALAMSAGLALGLVASDARAQVQRLSQINPVYVDESPGANDALARLGEQVASGSFDQAAALAQTVLSTQGERVAGSGIDAEVFVNVRARVHGLLLEHEALLAKYRAASGPKAAALLSEGKHAELEESYLLTTPGFDAALRLTQMRLERAQFESARRTLEQLERHPDRSGERGRQASKLAVEIARYLPRESVRAWAAKWASAAGVPPPTDAVAWPERANAKSLSPLGASPLMITEGLAGAPLWSAVISERELAPDPDADGPERVRGDDLVDLIKQGVAQPGVLPAQARDLLLLPTVWGDTVLINDGMAISALDRFTLSLRWSASAEDRADAPLDPNMRGMGRAYAGGEPKRDLGVVSVADGVAVAAVGRNVDAMPGSGYAVRELDRLLAVGVESSAVRWTSRLNELDASLEGAAVQGPPVIVEGVVVVAARKFLPERRLVSLSLVGVDLWTGERLWTRVIGSAGSMAWGMSGDTVNFLAGDRGVVCVTDALGVVGSVEASTGRSLWVRRTPVETITRRNDQSAAWEAGMPVMHGGDVLAIAADGERVLRINGETGEIKGERLSADFGSAKVEYLLKAGDRLVGVMRDQLASVPISDVEHGVVAASKTIDPPGLRGRVSVVGEGEATRLLAPTARGVLVLDPAMAQPPTSFSLDRPGQTLSIDSQLVVVDDTAVHSYLAWDVAEQLLRDRVAKSPDDPSPAVTFAELAHRANKTAQMGEAVGLAMAALRKAGDTPAVVVPRERLMSVLQEIVVARLEPRTDVAATSSVDAGLLSSIVGSMGELAKTPDDRLAFRLASGRVKELTGSPAEAAGEYHAALSDAALAGGTWRGERVAVRGELVATRRLEELVRKHGASAYAAIDAGIAAEIAALGDAPSPEALDAVLAKAPLSRAAVEAYPRLSELYEAAGKPQAATMALEAGLRNARRTPDAPPGAVGEIAGRLVTMLRQRGQPAAAAAVVRTVRRAMPTVTLSVKGQAVEWEKLESELSQALAASMRWPSVGPAIGAGAQAMIGSRIMEPLLRSPLPAAGSLLPLIEDKGVAIWARPSQAGSGGLERAWSRELDPLQVQPTLLSVGSDGAMLMYVSASEGWIERVGYRDGPKGAVLTSLWRSENVSAVFNRDDSRGMRRVPGVMADGYVVPGEGFVEPRGVLVSMDERTVVVVRRTGQATAIDADNGRTLWSGRIGVDRVTDVQVVGGTIAISGGESAGGAIRPVVQIIDARTGRISQTLGGAASGSLPRGYPRWVRLTESGAVIVGLEGAVASIDLAAAKTNWVVTQARDMLPLAAWVVGESIVVMWEDRNLWLVGLSDGRVRPQPLEISRTLVEATRIVDVMQTSALGGGFAVVSEQGLATFDAEGDLRGTDGLGAATTIVVPRLAEDRAITIETLASGRSRDGLGAYGIRSFDPSSATLIDSQLVSLGARPTSLMLLDGRIAITAGGTTVVLNAPGPKQSP